MIQYRWLDRRDHERRIQVFHIVDMSTRDELCCSMPDPAVIEGPMGSGHYCVGCVLVLMVKTKFPKP